MIISAAGVGDGASALSSRRDDDLTVATLVPRLAFATLLDGADALLVPTVGEHPTFDEVATDPIGVNVRLGRFTTFCNLLDLACAIAVPGAGVGRPPAAAHFGVTVLGPAFTDQVIADLAAARHRRGPSDAPNRRGAPIVVVGAHLDGQPLNGQLTVPAGTLPRPDDDRPVVPALRACDDAAEARPRPGRPRRCGHRGRGVGAPAAHVRGLRRRDTAAARRRPGRARRRQRVATGFVLAATAPADGLEEITSLVAGARYLASVRS